MLNMHQNCFFGRDSTPDPTGTVYSLRRSPEQVVGWGGGRPLPIPLLLDAFGLSIWAPLAVRFLPLPHYKFLATRLHATHPLSKNSGYAIDD